MPLNETRRNALVPLVLRIALAAVFIYHGIDKIATTDPVTKKSNDWGTSWANNLWERQARPPVGMEARVDQMAEDGKLTKDEARKVRENLVISYGDEHKKAPAKQLPGYIAFAGTQMAVAWGELICGVTLLLGLLTRGSAAVMILVQLGAIFTVTWAQGFTRLRGAGFEYNVVLIAACLALMLVGGGLYSLDNYIRERRRARAATVPPQTSTAAPAGV